MSGRSTLFARVAGFVSLAALAAPASLPAQIAQIPGVVMDDEPGQPVSVDRVTIDPGIPVLRGVVIDETGIPIRGATIRASSTQPYRWKLAAKTNKYGRFAFIVERPGQWDFTVEAPGFASAAGSAVVLLTSAQPRLEITLKRRGTAETGGGPAGAKPRSISDQLAGADALFAAGRYDEAIAAYETIRTLAPALTVVSLQLGNAYLRKQDYDRAEAEFHRVLKSDAANAAACYDLGEVKAARGASDEAVVWYQKAAADELWAKPLLRLAAIARSRGQHAAAVGYLKRVLALEPDSAEASEARRLLEQMNRAR